MVGFMVPASRFTYMSHLIGDTENPRALRSSPREAAVMPFPRPDTTPPEMKMYRVLSDTMDSASARHSPAAARGPAPDLPGSLRSAGAGVKAYKQAICGGMAVWGYGGYPAGACGGREQSSGRLLQK